MRKRCGNEAVEAVADTFVEVAIIWLLLIPRLRSYGTSSSRDGLSSLQISGMESDKATRTSLTMPRSNSRINPPEAIPRLQLHFVLLYSSR